jgi:acetyl esterase/lipase
MSLAWTSVPRGLSPPEAILAFYCPTDYEDDFWRNPNVPDHTETYINDDYDVMAGVSPTPIASYNADPKLMAKGGWMAPEDPRSRLILHMNWKGQTLPVLFGGLSSAGPSLHGLEQPPADDVKRASPHAQIRSGAYRSPTHIVFGTGDDLIPWQQAQRTVDAMREAGIESGLTLVQGGPHLFDIYPDGDGKRWAAVLGGYEFLFRRARER